MTSSPAEALFDHAARTPEDPWLFRREGWNWRWISFRAAADAVLSSISSGGGAPLPLGAGGGGTRGGGDGEGGGREGLSIDSILDDLARQAAGRPVVVRGPGGPIELSTGDLAASAAAIAACLPPARLGRREILVLGGSLDDPVARSLLSWGTMAGAALLLDPDPASVLGTAVWARPTVFAGSAAELAGLRIAAQRQDRGLLQRLLRRPPGLPFGRLLTVLVTDSGPLSPEDEAFWSERGVGVRLLPRVLAAVWHSWYIGRRGDRDA